MPLNRDSNMNQTHLVVGMGVLGVAIGIGIVSLLPSELNESNSTGNVANSQVTTPADSSTPSSVTIVPTSAPKGLEQSVLAAVDEMAAHPNDPQNQLNLIGVSDEEITDIPTPEIAKLIENTVDVAEQNSNPRYLFALGRAAWIHGDDEYAAELLEIAANRGSVAAEAYLGRITDDLNESVERFKVAVKGGFTPAAAWLQEAEQLLVQEKALQQQQLSTSQVVSTGVPDFSSFTLPEVVKDFYGGKTTQYRSDPLMIMTYVSGINETLSDQGMLFMLNNPKLLMREVDPTLGTEVGRKLATNPQLVQKTASVGLQNLWGALQSMAKVRQSGGSVSQEVAAMNQALMGKNGYSKNSKGATYITIQEMKQIGAKDGRILALLVDENPDAFRKIYRNMISFVRSL